MTTNPAETATPPEGLRWALPPGLEVPPDSLRLRLDFYSDSIVLHRVQEGAVTTRLVRAEDIIHAINSEFPISTGLLPPECLWWQRTRVGPVVALWRPPRVWRCALAMEAFGAPRRFSLPMPGLVFLCRAGRAPRVYAAERRPRSHQDPLYHAPLFNVFRDGSTCQGTHKYGQDLPGIPEEFFAAFFSPEGDTDQRSVKHPRSLLALWKELDGKRKYPMADLVRLGTVGDLMAFIDREG